MFAKLLTYLPFLSWIDQLKNRATLSADVLAGVTVALVLIPQSMAYAQLAGLPPQYGLYASFLPVMMAALMGSSAQLATGPVAVVSLLTAASLGTFVTTPETYVVYAALLAVMVGIFQFLLGVFKLGLIVNFLSHPVIIGFTNAAAIIITASQLPKILGVASQPGEYAYEILYNTLIYASSNLHFPAVLMTIFAFSIMILIKRYFRKLPGILIAVVTTTLASYFMGYANTLGGEVIGSVPTSLPSLVIPSFDFDVMSSMFIMAATISMIGFMEAISVAKAISAETKQRINVDQELVGQGLSNITAGFFQGYPVSGSFSRSAINQGAGAITGFSSVVSAILVGVALLWLTPLLYHLPQATLAAVIIMAMFGLIRFKPIYHAWKVEKHDAVVGVITFVMTILSAPHLENGIVIGIIFSLGLFLFRTMEPRFTELSAHDGSSMFIGALENDIQTCEVVSIVKYSGSLYFANAGYFENKILKLIADKQPCLKYIIVDMAGINQIDSSGEEVLTNLLDRCSDNGIEILFARMEGVEHVLERSGFIARFGEDRFYQRRTMALKYAWKQLGDEDAAANSPLKHLI